MPKRQINLPKEFGGELGAGLADTGRGAMSLSNLAGNP